jgi:hypothetical protein
MRRADPQEGFSAVPDLKIPVVHFSLGCEYSREGNTRSSFFVPALFLQESI